MTGHPGGHTLGGTEAPAAAMRVADELLRRYGLGAALHAEVVAGGMLNQNLKATTARGSFFLKGYRYVEPATVEREHRLVTYVAGQGVPAVTPLAAPGGATFLRVGGRLWAVFRLLADRQLTAEEVTPAVAGEMGRMLGRIHAALAQLPAAAAARFPPKLLWDAARALHEMAEYEIEIRRRAIGDPFDQYAAASFAYRRTLLASGTLPPLTPDALPAQMLHGDYHEGNLFFGPNGSISGVIDWELASVGPRAWEIARTLDVALDLPGDLAGGGERLRAFLHAYAAEAPLTREECLAMPDLYLAYRVHSLWIYEEHYRKGSARTDRLAIADVAGIDWWLRHRHDVAPVLADALRSAPRRLAR